MTKKEQLIAEFDCAMAMKCEFIAVAIKTEGNDDVEIIVNPRCNFENKLEYYKKAYDDNLVLKTFNGIKIVCACGFDGENDFDTISDCLLEEFV